MVMLDEVEVQLVSGGLVNSVVSGCFDNDGGSGGGDGYDADEALDALIQFLIN